MLGRVRACSLSSLEALELERNCCSSNSNKIIKDDSLSIYETTLMKLKEGSRRDLSSIHEDFAETDACYAVPITSSDEVLMTVEAPDRSSSDPSLISSDDQSMGSSKEQQNKTGNCSISYLFSKYKSSRNQIQFMLDENAMGTENGCSSDGISPPESQQLKERLK